MSPDLYIAVEVSALNSIGIVAKRHVRYVCRMLRRGLFCRLRTICGIYHRNHIQQPLSVRCRCSCRVVLPALVLVGVCVIADAPDDYTRILVHHSCCFHLKADDVVLLLDPVSFDGGDLQLVAGCDVAEMDGRLVNEPGSSASSIETQINVVGVAAFSTIVKLSALVLVGVLEEPVATRAQVVVLVLPLVVKLKTHLL
jgi:hypothetical protein